jgi:hypothetical protein
LINHSRITRANRNPDLDLSLGIYVGVLNDLSLGNGRDLAVFGNAASALRAVQSGVSPGSENPAACHANVA